MKRGLIIFSTLIFIIILYISLVSAEPYGYGDSMDLKYTSDGKIITYRYCAGIKYTRALKKNHS